MCMEKQCAILIKIDRCLYKHACNVHRYGKQMYGYSIKNICLFKEPKNAFAKV